MATALKQPLDEEGSPGGDCCGEPLVHNTRAFAESLCDICVAFDQSLRASAPASQTLGASHRADNDTVRQKDFRQ